MAGALILLFFGVVFVALGVLVLSGRAPRLWRSQQDPASANPKIGAVVLISGGICMLILGLIGIH